MKIEAKVVLKSKSELTGKELITMELTYPRFIHAELMTHRVFSRNASSSRAIPVKRLVDMALEDPAFFVHIGKNQPGMQANEEVADEIKDKFYSEWVELAKVSSEYALRWANDYGIHKQVVNRVMEPWHHIKVLVTATEWENFFDLRCHKDAQPEIQLLAYKIRDAINEEEAKVLKEHEWHLPYVRPSEKLSYSIMDQIKMSVARCARVSYMNHDGSDPDIAKDIELHDKLVVMKPAHSSPAEHQAFPLHGNIFTDSVYSSNLISWVQYRKVIENGGVKN